MTITNITVQNTDVDTYYYVQVLIDLEEFKSNISFDENKMYIVQGFQANFNVSMANDEPGNSMENLATVERTNYNEFEFRNVTNFGQFGITNMVRKFAYTQGSFFGQKIIDTNDTDTISRDPFNYDKLIIMTYAAKVPATESAETVYLILSSEIQVVSIQEYELSGDNWTNIREINLEYEANPSYIQYRYVNCGIYKDDALNLSSVGLILGSNVIDENEKKSNRYTLETRLNYEVLNDLNEYMYHLNDTDSIQRESIFNNRNANTQHISGPITGRTINFQNIDSSSISVLKFSLKLHELYSQIIYQDNQSMSIYQSMSVDASDIYFKDFKVSINFFGSIILRCFKNIYKVGIVVDNNKVTLLDDSIIQNDFTNLYYKNPRQIDICLTNTELSENIKMTETDTRLCFIMLVEKKRLNTIDSTDNIYFELTNSIFNYIVKPKPKPTSTRFCVTRSIINGVVSDLTCSYVDKKNYKDIGMNSNVLNYEDIFSDISLFTIDNTIDYPMITSSVNFSKELDYFLDFNYQKIWPVNNLLGLEPEPSWKTDMFTKLYSNVVENTNLPPSILLIGDPYLIGYNNKILKLRDEVAYYVLFQNNKVQLNCFINEMSFNLKKKHKKKLKNPNILEGNLVFIEKVYLKLCLVNNKEYITIFNLKTYEFEYIDNDMNIHVHKFEEDFKDFNDPIYCNEKYNKINIQVPGLLNLEFRKYHNPQVKTGLSFFPMIEGIGILSQNFNLQEINHFKIYDINESYQENKTLLMQDSEKAVLKVKNECFTTKNISMLSY